MTPYQRTVIEAWIAEAHASGEDRDDAIARAANALLDEQEPEVLALFDQRWPLANVKMINASSGVSEGMARIVPEETGSKG